MAASKEKNCLPPDADVLLTTEKKALSVFYDGECPYCHTEIKWYRFLSKKKSIQWVDITCNRTELERHGISYNQAMAELHVIGADGQQHTGVAGFLAIWAQLPFYRTFASIINRFPFVLGLLNTGYRYFAVWRLQRKLKK